MVLALDWGQHSTSLVEPAKKLKFFKNSPKRVQTVIYGTGIGLGSSWYSISETCKKIEIFQKSPQKSPNSDLWYWHWTGVSIVLL